MLRKVENIYYPLTICASSSSNSKTDVPPEVVDPGKGSPNKVPPPPSSPPKMAKQTRVDENGAEVTKEAAHDATVPLAAPQDPSKDKEDTRMEIVLASLPILAKGESKGADQGSSEVAA